MTERSRASRLYFDSNVFIYAVEGNEEFAEPLQKLFGILRINPGIALISELTLAEVLAKASLVQRRKYLSLIVWSGIFELCTVSRDVLIETATYRRTVKMTKLADAIHLVTAIRTSCDILLSADKRIKSPKGMAIVDPTPDSLSSLIQEFS